MKKILALLLLAGLLFGGYKERSHINLNRFIPYEPDVKLSSGAIFANKGNQRSFGCSGTEIGYTSDGGGIFLTARHCVADPDTNAIRKNLMVSFSDNEAGPYYDAKPIALSLTDDIAILYLVNGSDLPEVDVKDEHLLSGGDPIFNVSFPLGTGKETFHGEFLRAQFPILPLANEYPQWSYTMPINLTIAHGSSGSGVFSQREHALIAVAVGTFGEGSYNIAVPASRVINLMAHLSENSVEKFVKENPEREIPEGLF